MKDILAKEHIWENTLEIGEKFENLIIDRLSKIYPLTHKNNNANNFKYFDIIIPEINKTIECKYDEKSEETSNICIEVKCEGRKSGLLATKSDYWVQFAGNKVYVIKTNNIKKLIKEHYLDKGEDYNSHEIRKLVNLPVLQKGKYYKIMDFYLIKNHIFAEYSEEVLDINETTYKTII